MAAALLAVSAIAPSLLLVWFFHRRDAFPEPPRVLWTTFGLGVLTVGPVLLFAWPMMLWAETIDHAVARALVAAFLGAAVPEELCKLLVLWGYSMRQRAFDEPMDGVVYGATASLGFATFENVLYVSGEGAAAAILRALTAVPGHAFLGAIMGYYVGRARFATEHKRRSWMFLAFAVPTLLHGSYDFPLMAAAGLENPDSPAALPVLALLLLVPAVLCIELIWTLRLVRDGRRAQLAGGPPAAATSLPPLATSPATVAAPALRRDAEPEPERPPVGGRRGRLGGWLLTLGGGFLASVGGLVVFTVALGVLIEGSGAEELAALVLGTFLLGVIPAGAGCAIFLWGLRRLNSA